MNNSIWQDREVDLEPKTPEENLEVQVHCTFERSHNTAITVFNWSDEEKKYLQEETQKAWLLFMAGYQAGFRQARKVFSQLQRG